MFALAFAATEESRRHVGIVSQISLQAPRLKPPGPPVFRALPTALTNVSVGSQFPDRGPEGRNLRQTGFDDGQDLLTQLMQVSHIERGSGPAGFPAVRYIVGCDNLRRVDEAASVQHQRQRRG